MPDDSCPICLRQAEWRRVGVDTDYCKCPACGHFVVNGTVHKQSSHDGNWKGDVQRRRALASAWVRENRQEAEITMSDWQGLQLLEAPSVTDRATRLLRELDRGSEHFGASVLLWVADPRWLAASWSVKANEIVPLLEVLADADQVKLETGSKAGHIWAKARVTVIGRSALADVGIPNATSRIGFIAMAFRTELDAAHVAMRRAIEASGFQPRRVDDVEHCGRIDDRIIQEVRSCRFVVADFSLHRGGVYFEAGYAMGRGIPVVITCRKDDMKDLHFDIRQYNCIDWTDNADLEARLVKRLQALPELRMSAG